MCVRVCVLLAPVFFAYNLPSIKTPADSIQPSAPPPSPPAPPTLCQSRVDISSGSFFLYTYTIQSLTPRQEFNKFLSFPTPLPLPPPIFFLFHFLCDIVSPPPPPPSPPQTPPSCQTPPYFLQFGIDQKNWKKIIIIIIRIVWNWSWAKSAFDKKKIHKLYCTPNVYQIIFIFNSANESHAKQMNLSPSKMCYDLIGEIPHRAPIHINFIFPAWSALVFFDWSSWLDH